MPNWCNTTITFWSDDTPEGNASIKDLHDKIMWTMSTIKEIEAMNKCRIDFWESYLAEYAYGVNINAYRRGYIIYVSDLYKVNDYDSCHFMIECEDAWTPNIGFWYNLLKHFYDNHIDFVYQAYEPGCQACETNDPGLLPRYYAYLYVENLNQLLQYDKMWNWSAPGFVTLKEEYLTDVDLATIRRHLKPVFDENGKHLKDENGAFVYERDDTRDPICYQMGMAYDIGEGDEEYILESLETFKTLPHNATLQDLSTIFEKPDSDDTGLTISEYDLVDIETIVNQEANVYKVWDSVYKKLDNADESSREEYGKVSKLESNLFKFIGDNGGVSDE